MDSPFNAKEFDEHFDVAVKYVTQLLRGARELKALPIALIVSTEGGGMVMSDINLPRTVWPPLGDWIAMWPGKPRNPATGFTLEIPPGKEDN